MAFKLGKEKRGSTNGNIKGPSNTPIFRKTLEDGVTAEANMDGSIFVDSGIPTNSTKFKKIIKHEMSHKEDIETGRAAYGDEWVMWEDSIYFRKDINGEKVIDGPNGRWPEGHKNHPWEAKAIQAEKE
tara:strand:- start:992 stop:1375 length:384 start_codon:yes stop_codon:yes gene_type:complete